MSRVFSPALHDDELRVGAQIATTNQPVGGAWALVSALVSPFAWSTPGDDRTHPAERYPDNTGNQRLATWATAAAPKFGVDVVAAPLRDSTEIDAAMTQWGHDPAYGLIVLPDPSTNSHRKLIVELAARHRLPAIHALRAATAEGGLMSYGVDLPNLFRQAASYADRILKGESPAVLPVQLPTKFELVINLKTAKALGLEIPATVLARADEVIE